ncbi:hypothetical protein D0Z00_000639 [Geotrichum galactomycetum]|uniref:Uncharacterized protein n=1 Tax=Geotrichum galactomycetum TaxID=27317 RepID=A0ACB6V9E4_9ASCO|nr:hypothetical protein D0Z00_000639 [Geotrichum candidum]
MMLIIMLLSGKTLQLLFFGQLRELELQHLYERAIYAATDAFLLLTVFKDEFEFHFSLFLGLLFFLRVFHWITRDRVDLIFHTTQATTLLMHIRLATAIVLLGCADLLLTRYCVTHMDPKKPAGSMVMFAFEFALLSNRLLQAAGRYILNIIENWYLNNHEEEDVWEGKSLWTFVLEVAADSSRLLTYIAFFFVILNPYGLPPLHILRDVYVTVVGLFTRIFDFIKARHAQAAMDQEILTATEEDLSRDNVCIICREEMALENLTPRSTPKKLSCNHIIHYGCLKSWLERSLRCPTCRRPVLGHHDAVPVNSNANNNANFNEAVVINIAANNQQQQQEQQQQQQRDQEPLQQQPQAPQARLFEVPHEQQQQAQPPETFRPFNLDLLNTPVVSATTVAVTPQFESMVLQHHVEIPAGVQLPKGWGVFSARDVDGIWQVKLTRDEWSVVLPSPNGDGGSSSSSSSSSNNVSDNSNNYNDSGSSSAATST